MSFETLVLDLFQHFAFYLLSILVSFSFHLFLVPYFVANLFLFPSQPQIYKNTKIFFPFILVHEIVDLHLPLCFDIINESDLL